MRKYTHTYTQMRQVKSITCIMTRQMSSLRRSCKIIILLTNPEKSQLQYIVKDLFHPELSSENICDFGIRKKIIKKTYVPKIILHNFSDAGMSLILCIKICFLIVFSVRKIACIFWTFFRVYSMACVGTYDSTGLSATLALLNQVPCMSAQPEVNNYCKKNGHNNLINSENAWYLVYALPICSHMLIHSLPQMQRN